MSELHQWVPDGDPCPKHPTEKSRLSWCQGIGLFSQCRLCMDEFLAWYSASMNERAHPLVPAPPKEPAMQQLNLLGATDAN